MMFNRIEAKFAAKASMRQARPNVMLVSLVYVLLTTGLTFLVNKLVGDPMTEVVDYLSLGYGPEEVFQYVILGAPGHVAVFAVVSLLLDFYGAIMSFGYTSYALRLSRNEQPGYANLFDGFALAGRVLWAGILVGLITTLWSLLGLIPGVVLLIGGIMAESLEMVFSGYFVMILGMAAVSVIVALRYRLVYYFMLDDPECTAREAITRSKVAMKGWKIELLTLDLSFLGWSLLVGVTAGIAGVWVLPYINVTEANFYAAVSGNGAQPYQPPQGGYQGPYDYHSNDGPAAF